MLRLVFEGLTTTIISTYALQVGIDEEVIDTLYGSLLQTSSRVSTDDFIIAGDFNGHVGRKAEGFDGVHGSFGFGLQNPGRVKSLEFCDTMDLTICNMNFRKRDNRLVTYSSGFHSSQIDFGFVKRKEISRVQDTKVILSVGGGKCLPQHTIVVSDLILETTKTSKQRPVTIWRRKTWRLREENVKHDFHSKISEAYKKIAENLNTVILSVLSG
ncbi:hypothetical protein Ahia01_000135500 [Argonauta hians]